MSVYLSSQKVINEETKAKLFISVSWLLGIKVITSALIKGKKTTADNPTPFANISNFPPI